MKFWVGVTDNRWYEFLAQRRLDEVNFWQPSATPPFKGAPVGMPFLFKLKRPNNHIAGGGFFVTYSTLPVPLAWEIFGEKNGAAALDEFFALLGPLASGRGLSGAIGCTVLTNPFFLPAERWVEPPGWAPNIVRGKMYETSLDDGSALWAAVARSLSQERAQVMTPEGISEEEAKYGPAVLVSPRLGQASFRVLITDAYKRRCAITGESTLIALEAAHIVPYAHEGTHDVRNGLLLRADFHRLYDAGLVSVTPGLRIKISPRIHEAYFNGKAYYRMNDASLTQIPDRPEQRPDPDRLNWHYKNCFQA
ncbi:MAG: HNH endonuclease [Rhodanobacter sp.]|nr:MAG: HNH endonuclease [Rhodanobacter sp.]TAN23654.1 MAG: HNH endonuclease [Rhodanobacter sp.]